MAPKHKSHIPSNNKELIVMRDLIIISDSVLTSEGNKEFAVLILYILLF